MPRDPHVRIAAILHIVSGAFLLLVFVVIGLVVAAIGALGPSHGVDREVAEMVGGVGVLSAGAVSMLCVAEIVGAVLLLKGRSAGRVMIIGFSVLSLFNIPVGTAIGIYSLWALLRETPRPVPADARFGPQRELASGTARTLRDRKAPLTSGRATRPVAEPARHGAAHDV